MEESVRKDGEAAAFELGMHDLHPELQKLMGRLKYRTSYGQNVLNHSKEVAYLAGIMAKEVGLDASCCVRAAFLHDCGKAINRELAGCDLLTISPDLLESLQNTPGELTPRLTAEGARTFSEPRLSLDEKTFRWMHNEDAMAVEKLSDGIRRFNEDARKLEQWAAKAVTV